MTPRNVKNPSGYHSKGKSPKEKVVNFAAFIKEFAWTGSWKEDPTTGDITLIATREAERIEVYWNTPIAWPEVFYSYAGHKIKCRNVSAAAKIAQGEPDPERMRRIAGKLRVGTLSASMQRPSGPVGRPDGAEVPSDDPGDSDVSAGDLEALRGYVPWDKASTPEEVKAELMHYRTPTITWVNRIAASVDKRKQGPDNTINTATINTKSRKFNVSTNKTEEVIINFTDRYGFHAVYAHTVIGVQ